MNYTREENKITVTKDDLTYEAKRTDPYGFWIIKGKKGKQKIPLDGEYTSTDSVMRIIKKSIANLS